MELSGVRAGLLDKQHDGLLPRRLPAFAERLFVQLRPAKLDGLVLHSIDIEEGQTNWGFLLLNTMISESGDP